MRTLSIFAILTFAIDQLSKWFVVHVLDLRTVGEMDVFPPFLVFHMAWNTGINFGLFSQYAAALRWGWVALAIAMSVWVILWARREGFGVLGQISAGLLVGGALGNAVDRVIYGAVADFLNMSCCGFSNPFSFNVADVTIFAGAFGLILFTDETKKQA